MKLIISLAIFFAFIFYVQALTTFLEFKVRHNSDFLEGKFSGQIVGKTKTHDFTFEKDFFFQLDVLKYNYDFKQTIRYFKITWNSESSEPIELKPLIVTWYVKGKESDNNVYLPEKKHISQGETISFLPA